MRITKDYFTTLMLPNSLAVEAGLCHTLQERVGRGTNRANSEGALAKGPWRQSSWSPGWGDSPHR